MVITKRLQRTFHVVVGLGLAFALSGVMTIAAQAATLTSALVGISDSRPGWTNVQYTLRANGFTTGTTIGCIEVDMGSAADGTGAITGMNAGSSTFVSQSVTATGTWTVDNTVSGGSTHTLRMTNSTPVVPQSGSQTAVWGGITNGSTASTPYYAKVTTYTTSACTTPVDTTTVQFIYTDGQSVSVTVDPSLSFAVAGTSSGTTCNGATSNITTTSTTVPLGTPTTSLNRTGVQNLTATTNSSSGYSIYTKYTAQPTSGGNTISDHSGSNASPTAFSAAGTEAYGYTTNDATLGSGTANRFTNSGPNWAAFTTNNEEVAFNGVAVSNQTTCVAQQVGISGTTEAGTYTTTVVYTATPAF